MPEPSLSEITNINVDPQLGGGVSNPVIDNSKVVDMLNQNARFYADQTWKKYTTFLENKKELFKNIGDIQGLETAQQDRDLLKGQAAEILADIAKDPSIVTGGEGYAELQGKIAKFKSDAMTSKQDKVDDDANAKFIAANPELFTDENKAKRENFWKAPLGARKPVMLDMPTIFDEKTAFEGVLKNTTQPYTAIVGKDGKPGSGYIETGNEVSPKALTEAWNLALEGQQDKYGHSILKAVQRNYDALPENVKKQYEANGGVKKFFEDRGKQYVDAYFPEGTYEKTPEGNYRFGKKLTADPNYLGAERLALQEKELKEKTENDRANRNIEWAKIDLRTRDLDKVDAEDSTGALSVLNEAASIINNGTPIDIGDKTPSGGISNKRTVLRISDPTLLQKFGNVDKDGKVVNVPDAINFDPKTNQPTLLYYKKLSKEDELRGKTQKENFTYEREIPLDQRTWLKVITQRSFPNKDIGEINNLVEKALLQNNNSIYEISQKLKNQNQQQATPAQTTPQKVMTPAEFDAYLKKKGLK